MATAPVLTASYPSLFNAGTRPQSVSVTVAVGDVLVCLATAETQLTWSAPTSSPALTWTLLQNVTVASYCASVIYTATVGPGQDGTYSISMTNSSGTLHWGFIIERWSGSAGVGVSAKTNVSSGAPSLALAGCSANSAVTAISGDFAALSGARTWRTVNSFTPTSGNGGELVYVQDGSFYTVYVGRWTDVGAAGSKTVGLSAPTGQKYAICAVEILGTSSVPADMVATAPAAEAALTAASRVTGAMLASAQQATAALTSTSRVTGALAATASQASAAFTALQRVTGTMVATAPTATASLTATARVTVTLAAVAPSATSALVASARVTGSMAAVAPTAQADLTTTSQLTAAMAATAPEPTASLAIMSGQSATLTATAPTATAALAVQSTSGAVLQGTGPAATASLSASSSSTASLAAVAPAPIASLQVAEEDAPIEFDLSALAPVAQASFAMSSGITAALGAVGPAPAASFTVDEDATETVTMALAAVAPAPVAQLLVFSPISAALVAVAPSAQAALVVLNESPGPVTHDRVFRVPAERRRTRIAYDDRRAGIEPDSRVTFAR